MHPVRAPMSRGGVAREGGTAISQNAIQRRETRHVLSSGGLRGRWRKSAIIHRSEDSQKRVITIWFVHGAGHE